MKRKNSVVLLSILLFSMLAFALPIKATVTTQDEKPTFPWEMNSGVGRPYQDITGFQATMINATHLQINVTLDEGPPKADGEKHLKIYVVMDTDHIPENTTGTNTGNTWFPDSINARYAYPDPADGPGNCPWAYDYSLNLYRWTTAVQNVEIEDDKGALVTTPMVTNSSDGRTVMTVLNITDIGSPDNVTFGVVTGEGWGAVSGEPNMPPYPASAHIFRDTIGNASFDLWNGTWGQWLQVEPAIWNFTLNSGNSASVSDPVGDFCVLPFNDITQVATWQTEEYVFINATLANVWAGRDYTAKKDYWCQEKWYMWTGRWLMSIGVDTDHQADSGQKFLAGFGAYIEDATHCYLPSKEHDTRDVQIHPDNNSAYWERCIVVDFPTGKAAGTPVHLYDTEMNDLGTGGIVVTDTYNTVTKSGIVTVKIPKFSLGLTGSTPLTLTIVSGQAWMYLIEDVVGYYDSTTDYAYDAEHPQGYYKVHTTIPQTEEITLPPPKPGQRIPTPPRAMGRPYQNITEVAASLDATNLKVNVTLDGAPPKQDNETHVNMYVAIDNDQKTDDDEKWLFPDEIDVVYTTPAYYWEYCLALYNWTGATQHVDLINETFGRTNALAQGVTVTNTTDGKTVMITVPISAIDSPSTVTLGVVTTEGVDNRTAGKIKDTVGDGYAYAWASQVVEIQPAIIGLSTGGSQSATDTKKGFLGKSYWDITDVTVGATDYVMMVNLTFLNVSTLAWSMGQWRLAIGIDSDHVAGSGQDWMAFRGYCDARIDDSISTAYWERCVVIDSPVDIHLYDKDFNDYGASGIWAELNETLNKMIVYIPTWNLPVSDDRSFKLTIISGMDSGNTVYDTIDTPPSYTYYFDPTVNTQGFYNLTNSIATGIVAPSIPYPNASFNNATGRPYQDIREVSADYTAPTLNVNVTLNEASLKGDNEEHVNIYVALDTADGGQSYFPDSIDARYDVTKPEYFWEYCLALYAWTGATQHGNLYDKTWVSVDAFSNSICNATVTNSTNGKTVMITMDLTIMDTPSNVTIGVVTSEDGSKIKDTVGNGTAILLGGQWIQVEPAIVDLSSPASVTDPKRDFCGKSFWDITDVVVNVDLDDITIETTFLNVTGIDSDDWLHWYLSIEIDTDHVPGSGLYFSYGPGPGSDSTYPNMSTSCWEVDAVIHSDEDIHLWNITKKIVGWQTSLAQDAGKGGIRVSLNKAKNKVTVAIPRVNVTKAHDWTDYYFTITVVSGTHAGNIVYDVYGNYTYAHNPKVSEYSYHGGYHLTTDPSLNRTLPYKALISMLNGKLNITTTNIDLDHWFSGLDADVNVTWLTYTFEQQTTWNIWTGNLPHRETRNENKTHPLTYEFDTPVEVVELVLVRGGEEFILARFTVSRPVLITRLGELDYLWTVPGADRSTIMKEYVAIDGQWPYAPAR